MNIKINTISSLKAYLISNNTKDNKMAVIEDNKGFYISVFDSNNNEIVEECYKEVLDYNYEQVPHKLDIEKIIDYLENIESENPHFIKANYIKKIEVEEK